MTPEQAALVTTLLAATEKISSGPIWSIIFFLVVGPWVLALVLSYNSQKRFESVVGMYDSNVKLVESYEKLAWQLTDVLTLNIEVQTRLVEKIEKNMFCPAVRDRGDNER